MCVCVFDPHCIGTWPSVCHASSSMFSAAISSSNGASADLFVGPECLRYLSGCFALCILLLFALVYSVPTKTQSADSGESVLRLADGPTLSSSESSVLVEESAPGETFRRLTYGQSSNIRDRARAALHNAAQTAME